MATAQSLMDKALRSLGALRLGASAASSMQSEALSVLNGMIDRWLTERLVVPQILQTTKTLTAGDGEYTVVASGDINIARPIDVLDTSFYRYPGGTQDCPLRKLTRQQYNAIGLKSQSGPMDAFFYDDTFATARLYLWPVPDQAYVLYLDYWGPISSFATAGTDNALPPAYESALWQNLALELLPLYPNPLVASMVMAAARRSKAAIQTINVDVPILGRIFAGHATYDAVSDR